MSTLNSQSTLAEVQAAYDDNASYEEDRSVPKCRAFITSCRMLLRRTPRRSGTPDASIEMAPDLIQTEKAAAERWLAANDTGSTAAGGPRVTGVSFEDFRR